MYVCMYEFMIIVLHTCFIFIYNSSLSVIQMFMHFYGNKYGVLLMFVCMYVCVYVCRRSTAMNKALVYVCMDSILLDCFS